LLGQIDGFVSAGEVRQIWRRGLVGNASCGCGSSFRECEYWQRVGMSAYGGWDHVDAREALELRLGLDRGWAAPLLATRRSLPSWERRLERYGELLGPLYRSIASEAGAQVVVDSSKLPSHALILRRVGGFDVRLVHLVRDSRGVASSWQRNVVKDPATGERMLIYRPWASALRYDVYNGMTGLVGSLGTPYLRVRYEDLIAHPEPIVRRIIRHVHPEETPEIKLFEGRAVELGVQHTMGGNPLRFLTGSVELRPDERWRTDLNRRDRVWVTALTAPMLARYGYPVRLDGRRGGVGSS
jgi:hypothetical protein